MALFEYSNIYYDASADNWHNDNTLRIKIGFWIIKKCVDYLYFSYSLFRLLDL